MKKLFTLLTLLCLACSFSHPAFAAQPATTTTVFNKRFIHSLRPAMSYEQLVSRIGTPGARMGEQKGNTPAATMVRYGWNGGRRSSLEVHIRGGRLSHASMRAPNGHTYLLDSKGTVTQQ